MPQYRMKAFREVMIVEVAEEIITAQDEDEIQDFWDTTLKKSGWDYSPHEVVCSDIGDEWYEVELITEPQPASGSTAQNP